MTGVGSDLQRLSRIWAITHLTQGRQLTGLWIAPVTGVVALSLLGQLFFGRLSVRDSWLSSYELAGDLRLIVLNHVRRLLLAAHQARHCGDPVSALTSDMQMLEIFFSHGLPSIAASTGLPLAIFCVLLIQDWRVGLIAAVSTGLALPVFLATSRHAHHPRLLSDEPGAIGIREARDAFRDISPRMAEQLAAPMAFFEMVVTLCVLLMIWLAGSLFAAGQVSPFTAISVLGLIFSMYAPLLSLIDVMEAVRIKAVYSTNAGTLI